MQYILSEDEYKAFLSRQLPEDTNAQKKAQEASRVKILEMAEADCIHSGLGYRSRKTAGYCDKCPIVQLADSMGMGRTGRSDYLNILCTKSKDFSK